MNSSSEYMPKIVWIGAGNLASCIAKAMAKKGIKILQVFSRTEESAQSLATQVNAKYCIDIKQITPHADIYIFALKDAVLESTIRQMPFQKGIWLHTAGSIPMQIFQNQTNHYGVLYPLQTFTKGRDIDVSKITFFIEASDNDSLTKIEKLVSLFSQNCIRLDSEKRKWIHLAAVFACNFTNHIFTLSEEILNEIGIPFATLLPLIEETTAKIHDIPPSKAQTGPAIRYDNNVIEKHIALLDSLKEEQKIYKLMSESIYNYHKTQKK